MEDAADGGEREWHRFGAEAIERRMLETLGAHLGARLRPRTITLDDGNRAEIEGVDAGETVIVQLMGNLGAFKPQYRNKAIADMFKLEWMRRAVFPGALPVLCVTDAVARIFTPTAWTTSAARDLGIDVLVYRETEGEASVIEPLISRVEPADGVYRAETP